MNVTPAQPCIASDGAPTMDAATLAAFYGKFGLRVVRSASAWWVEAGPRFLLAVPSHHAIHVPDDEARELFRRERVAGLRYMCDESDIGKKSFQLSCSDAGYSIEKLSANTRSKVRRGLSRNELRRIGGAELLEVGQGAFMETMRRQNRASASTLETWKRMLRAADSEPAIEIWSAWHEGEFASYLITIRIDDVCEFFQARSRNELLKHYPNNALIFHVTEEMLVRRGIREITFGIESPEDVEDLDAFKLALGYEKKPIRQRVLFHPLLRAALGVPPLRRLLHIAGARPGANVKWRKASGLVRFAEEQDRGE
ncbi:MAG: GNAT family N-acetyltransferase [Deltaproteobacteria bacterium]|nr:GNAT family N-acetyltransferase [Deltaproteobacteria bacterium]